MSSSHHEHGVSHAHGHHHHHHDHATLSSANREHFDKQASHYAHAQTHIDVAGYIASAIVGELSSTLSESSTRVLDYACGPGLLSRALLKHVASITGVDVSPNMVAEYNATANNQGLTEGEMHAVTGDLCSEDEGVLPEVRDFDLAVCSLSLHHIADPALAVKRLVDRLKPETGILAIADFRPHEKSDRLKSIVSHHGFTEEQINTMFTEAGLVDVKFVEVGPPGGGGKGVSFVGKLDDGKEYTIEREVFLAIGRKGRA